MDIINKCEFQIINGTLYREDNCYFPARCAGVEHYLKLIAGKLPDTEFSINTRDWPQFNSAWGHQLAPIFSFSKVPFILDVFATKSFEKWH